MAGATTLKIRRITGLFTLRRSRWSLLGPRSGSTPSLYGFGLAKTKGHIFAALVLLRKPLFGLQKRRKQASRYVTCRLK